MVNPIINRPSSQPCVGAILRHPRNPWIEDWVYHIVYQHLPKTSPRYPRMHHLTETETAFKLKPPVYVYVCSIHWQVKQRFMRWIYRIIMDLRYVEAIAKASLVLQKSHGESRSCRKSVSSTLVTCGESPQKSADAKHRLGDFWGHVTPTWHLPNSFLVINGYSMLQSTVVIQGGTPPVISWFINHRKYRYIYHKT